MTGPADKPENTEPHPSYTGAELRMARRKARRLGINVANGSEAVRVLKERGITIDDNEVTMAESAKVQASAQSTALARTKQASENLPAEKKKANNPLVQSQNERAKEVQKLERKIRKRRETRFRRMLRRFFVFVILPTLIMWVYYAKFATELYVSKSEMTIQSASSGGNSALSNLIPTGGILGDPAENVGVESFLRSRQAFQMLEEDYGFSQLFINEEVDRLRRLDPDATAEEKYKNYGKYVKANFDNTDSVIRLEVRMFTPEQARDISNLLIGYAENNIDQTTQRIRDESVAASEETVVLMRERLEDAKNNLLALQREQQQLNPEMELTTQSEIISETRLRLAQKEEERASLMANQNPNQARLLAVENEIDFLSQRLSELQANSVGNENEETITEQQMEMQFAQDELARASANLALAEEGLQNARSQAVNQGKFLAPTVRADTSFEPVYPKTMQSVLAAFFVIFAFYLFVTMTIEVIREQASV